jgi:hypothetical protein
MNVLKSFADRANRLNNISKWMPSVHGNFPLLKISRISSNNLDKLKYTVNLYLLSCLKTFYAGQTFKFEDSVLKNYPKEIRGLPNITPNGLMLPKQETYKFYNKVHAVVADIFGSMNLETHIESVHAPINIRLVDGTPNPLIDNRPRASVKMHSDMWAGEPANAIMIFLPVFGEHRKIGVKWVEPRTFPLSFARPLDDFDEGRDLIVGGREYVAGFNPGDLLLVDPFLLHATQKDSFGMRLSIDFRFISSKYLTSDKYAPGTRQNNYISYPDWLNIGRTLCLVSEEPLGAYEAKDNPTNNDYAAKFKIVSLDETL